MTIQVGCMGIDSAVVLAAGEGTRLGPLTRLRPKPMLPVANRPILEFILDSLIDAGIDDIHLVIGYKRDRVQDHFGPSYRGCQLTYHIQEKQLGTGHALLQVEPKINSDFLVVNGDEVLGYEMIEAVIEAHSRDAVATLGVVESDQAPEYGAVRLEGTTMTELIEKPRDGDYRLLNAGIYVFGPSIFTEIDATPQEGGELGLTQTIARMIDRGGAVCGAVIDGIHTSATYPWNLLDLNTELLSHRMVDEPNQGAETFVADSAQVHDDASLRGPVVVGPDVTIEPGAVVGPYVSLGTNSTVKAGAVVERSIIDTDTRVGLNTTLVETVTGAGVVFGEGVTVPQGPGDVRIETTVHEGKPLGAVIADRSRIGGGAVVAPGTLVGPEASIGAGTGVERNVADGAELRR